MAELRTLARPYAKAIFKAAQESTVLQSWSDQLAALGAVAADTKINGLISSPTISGEKQVAVLTDLLSEELTQGINNFLVILADNKRLALLPTIAELFLELKANLERTVEVSISTAFALDPEVEAKLGGALKDKLQREVKVNTAIDKSLLGGVLIRAGDIVIDGSVKGRLAKLAEALSI